MYGNYPAYNPVPDPAMAAMQERLKNMQQQYRPMPPQPAMPMYGIKGRPVTNIEEARAAQIDFDGSMSYFPCPAERKIFAKGLDLNGVQRDLCTGFSAVNAGIAENRFAAQQCCCETNRNIDAVRAENYKNTCEITNAIHAEGEATRALINHNVMQDLRDRLADRDRDLQSANFQLSQLSQTANIVGTLRPFPQPAYITASPYQAASTVYGCGCANSCGC